MEFNANRVKKEKGGNVKFFLQICQLLYRIKDHPVKFSEKETKDTKYFISTPGSRVGEVIHCHYGFFFLFFLNYHYIIITINMSFLCRKYARSQEATPFLKRCHRRKTGDTFF